MSHSESQFKLGYGEAKGKGAQRYSFWCVHSNSPRNCTCENIIRGEVLGAGGEREINRYTDATARAAVCEAVA